MRVELANELLNFQSAQLALIIKIIVEIARRVHRNRALNLLLHCGRRAWIVVIATICIVCTAA
jgi:hypothetical protein